MVQVDECGNITVTRGDTLDVPVMVYTDDTRSEAYRLAEGEKFRFRLRAFSDGEAVYEKYITAQAEDGSFTIALSAAQTAELLNYAYMFDLALISADGTEQYTFFGGEEIKKTLRVV